MVSFSPTPCKELCVMGTGLTGEGFTSAAKTVVVCAYEKVL